MIKISTRNQDGINIIKEVLSHKRFTIRDSENRQRPEIIVDGGDESTLRLILQEELDRRKFNYIREQPLVDGNGLYSFDLIKKEVNKMKRGGVNGQLNNISNYFYNFMYLNFTIAYYNKHGWLSYYPTWNDIKTRAIKENGGRIPLWKSDVNRIVNNLF
jgi:hypothetical protein